jgi:hypothetical protein
MIRLMEVLVHRLLRLVMFQRLLLSLLETIVIVLLHLVPKRHHRLRDCAMLTMVKQLLSFIHPVEIVIVSMPTASLSKCVAT